MPDRPVDAGPTPAEAYDRVRSAVGRADESLALIDGIPIAGTQGARNAAAQMRLGVLERMLVDVRAAVGLEPPPAAGQQELDVEEPSA